MIGCGEISSGDSWIKYQVPLRKCIFNINCDNFNVTCHEYIMCFLLPFQVSWFKKAQGPEGGDDLHVLTIGRETFSADTVTAFYNSNQIQNSPPCSLMPETRFYAIKMIFLPAVLSVLPKTRQLAFEDSANSGKRQRKLPVSSVHTSTNHTHSKLKSHR